MGAGGAYTFVAVGAGLLAVCDVGLVSLTARRPTRSVPRDSSGISGDAFGSGDCGLDRV